MYWQPCVGVFVIIWFWSEAIKVKGSESIVKKLLTKLLKYIDVGNYILTYSDNFKSCYLDLGPEVKIQQIWI